MEMITTEVVETGRKYDVKGRRLVAAAERAALLAAYDGCGLTQVEFARREGIKYSTFTTWLQERRHAARKAKEPAPKMRFEEVRLPAQSAHDGLEVRLPDGMVIRGASALEVAELLRALRA
jgi:hypothetical protein